MTNENKQTSHQKQGSSEEVPMLEEIVIPGEVFAGAAPGKKPATENLQNKPKPNSSATASNTGKITAKKTPVKTTPPLNPPLKKTTSKPQPTPIKANLSHMPANTHLANNVNIPKLSTLIDQISVEIQDQLEEDIQRMIAQSMQIALHKSISRIEKQVTETISNHLMKKLPEILRSAAQSETKPKK